MAIPSNEPSAPIVYNSTFRHGVDEKRRVQIPAMWRPAQADVELTLIFWPQHKAGPCLRVLPPKEMAELMADLDRMENSNPNKTVMKRFIGSESVQVTLDKVGRICVPEDKARAAGISDEVVLVGLLDRFEIWNPERYATVKTADAVLAQQAFAMME
ncbi:MAG: hypothetical protein H7X97_05735 [Opitutaceae bacterium]|nr:hypothetical protein [Verrucomicrobiales bacterium]